MRKALLALLPLAALLVSGCDDSASCEDVCHNAVDYCDWFDYRGGYDDCVDSCEASDFDHDERDCLAEASCKELSRNACYPDHHHRWH